MVVAIAGAHGKIGLRLSRILTERGDRVLGVIRDPGQAGDLAVAGAEAVVRDLERDGAADVADGIAGAEAIVFSAGAGPGSGAERKLTLDRDGAILMIEAAKLAGASRYVIVSSMGADPSHAGDEVFDVYLRAKGEADEAVASSGLGYTIVRPGMLTDEPGTGRVRIGESVGRGEVSRDDVAAVLAATLTQPATIGKRFELVGGDDEIEAAVAKLAG